MGFIDANQYLLLYETGTGKKLLAPLKEQQDHIFVTAQIVDEVQRNKVAKAASFLAKEFEKLELRGFLVPDHLFLTTGQDMQKRLQEIRCKIEAAREELRSMTRALLGEISRSEDEVSKALAGIFANAVKHTDDELQRAKARAERGNAPGKKADPLGDQLSWEQILSQCKDKKRLWIITRDGDYATKYGGKLFLNAALYQDLARLTAALREPTPEVFCFDNIADGIKHFAETEHVKAEKLPTPEETERIRKEQEALPPIGWLTSGVWSTTITPRTGVLGFGGGQPITETRYVV